MILAAALFLSLIIPAGAAELEPSEPEETAAAETFPEETLPETVPETTLPEETLPEETVPPTVPPTFPAQTQPITEPTAPEETMPATEPATEPPEETAAATESPEEPLPEPESPSRTVVTIAQALALPVGAEEICIQGTVVYAKGTLAVLQDETGGIRVAFETDPGTFPGEILRVTGTRGTGLTVTDFESCGTGTLPAVQSTLLEAPDNIRASIRGAILGENTLTQQGFSVSLEAESYLPAGTRVDAWGIFLDGRFYADTLTVSASQETEAPESDGTYKLYFGQLHAHRDERTPGVPIEEIFAAAANTENLDFFAITDHSDSLDNAAFGSVGINGADISVMWAQGKAAAAAVTGDTFVGIYGYEMSWPEWEALGHINTFGTRGWQSHTQPGFATLESYVQALKSQPDAVSQFNHPSHFYGNFQMFSGYTPELDQHMHLIELGDFGDPGTIDYYSKALDKGWHLAPAWNPGKTAGVTAYESPVRTVVLATELTDTAIYEAIRNYRVYATQDPDLSIRYQLNGAVMGSILGPAESYSVSLALQDPTDPGGGLVEVIVDGGNAAVSQSFGQMPGEVTFAVPAGSSYYYLRITQPDGDTAVTAPVWVDNYEDMGIQNFTASQEDPVEGQEVALALQLFNREPVPFLLESLEFYQGDVLLSRVEAPGTVHSMQDLTYRLPYSQERAGQVIITARATGTAAGHRRSYSTSLTLHFQPKQLAVSTISQVRTGFPGQAFRVSGYLTSGTSNVYNTFRSTLYLQDDTGGIAVSGDFPSGLEIGTPMEITGVLRKSGGNLLLEMTAYTLPGGTYYRYTPRTMSHETAMDYTAHGGELLQVEGTVVSLTKTADGKGISRLTLKDARGDLATVMIEDNIGSGAYGVNELASKIKKGRTVRAMGLLHLDEFGDPVLRVRNCEEVVYVPAIADPSNPRTGDWVAFFFRR